MEFVCDTNRFTLMIRIMMTQTQKKLSVAFVILAVAAGYLCYVGVQAGRSFYLSVDEFLADAQYHALRVRLHGAVGPEGLFINPSDRTAAFIILGTTHKLKVEYSGPVPDTFQAGGEVVVVGQMSEDSTFHAEELLTKCASKYEMKKIATEKPL